MWLLYVGLPMAVIAFAVLIFCLRGGALRTVRYTVSLKGLPAEFDGYRIALISDLHDRRFGKTGAPLVKAIFANEPDLTVIAGDLHEGEHDVAPVAEMLSTLTAKIPVTYTEGNHDIRKGRHGISDSDYAEYLPFSLPAA